MEHRLISTFLHIFHVFMMCYSSPIYVEKNGNDVANCWKLGQSCPCATLDYALEGAQLFQDVRMHIAPGTYKLSNNSATCFTGKSSFSLMGEERGTVRVVCDNYTGLSFINSNNIQIYNVTFLSCGAEHVSSSNDMHSSSDSHTAYLSFLTGLYFLFCTNVSLSHVEVSDSVGTGLVLYSTGGTNYMTQCTFNNNTAYNRSNKYSAGGGGVAIEFLFCKPGDTDCLEEHPSKIDTMHQQNVSYVFTNCTFSNNNGSTNNFSGDSFIVPHANHNIALGRGGGLSVLFKGNSYANQVTLHNCTFRDNIAVWGGGMLIEFQDMAKNNTVSLKKVTFTNNRCDYNPCTYQGTGGGGARIQFAGFSKNVSGNIVGVYDTVFSGNAAYFGGGVSFFTFPEPNQTWSTNSLHFSNTVWLQNRARLGSAVDLSLWSLTTNGAVVNPIFDECNFTNNTVHYADISGIPEGIGTVYTNSIPIAFNKSVHFTDNKGSALVSLDAGVEFHSDNVVVFYNNKGRVGAAITLFSQAYILVNERSLLSFENNTATLYGGGIYWESIGDHQLISSRNCFIRYKNMFVDPTDWKVSFNFSYNRAGIAGNSIYATTLLSCLWGGNPYGKLIDPEQEYREVFYWKPNNESLTIWNYNNEDSSNKSEVATAAAYFSDYNYTVQCGAGYNIRAVPGETLSLPIFMVNDRFDSIPNNSLIFSTESKVPNVTYTYISPEDAIFYGDIGAVVDVHIDTVGARAIASRMLVTLESCPPGFEFNKTDRRCQGANYPYVRTNDDMEASIQFGYWMGFLDSNKKEIGIGICFYCTFNEEVSKYALMPKTNAELNDFFCKKSNRKGILCGACRDGYAPAVNSYQYKCVKCSSDNSKYSWALYILTEFVPITVILVTVIIFNISITSGPANAFVFFAQVISATFGTGRESLDYSSVESNEETFEDIYLSLYGVWNLQFLNDIRDDKWLYCLGPSLTVLHIQLLHYLSAAYPLLLILIASVIIYLYDRNTKFFVCIFRPIHNLSARLLRRLNFKNSIMDAFATFIVLSYVKFAVISSFILYPVQIYGTDDNVKYLAAHKYGNIRYASWQYAPYLIIAAFVLFLCTLVPIFLILYSIKPYYSFLEHYCLKFLLPGEKLRHFLISFHHCYKDGSQSEHDRRYFAAVYFLLRLVLISCFAYSPNWVVQYVWQQVICTIGLLLFSIFQPYKNNWYNALDAGMFTLLSIINIFSFYNRYLQAANLNLSPFFYWFQLVLIYLPLIYICVYVIIYVITSNRNLLKKIINKLKKKRVQDLDDFGEYVDHITSARLHEHNQYHGPVTVEDIQHAQDEQKNTLQPILSINSHALPPDSRRRSTEPILPRRSAELSNYGATRQ